MPDFVKQDLDVWLASNNQIMEWSLSWKSLIYLCNYFIASRRGHRILMFSLFCIAVCSIIMCCWWKTDVSPISRPLGTAMYAHIIFNLQCWRMLSNSPGLSFRLHYCIGYTWQIPKTRSSTLLTILVDKIKIMTLLISCTFHFLCYTKISCSLKIFFSYNSTRQHV